MALKNTALDEPILEAAREEFLMHGFEAASLRKIAAAAGVTVGAIYTRYPTKDLLFGALVQPLIEAVGLAFEQLRGSYYQDGGDPSRLIDSMELESETILHLLFEYYDQAVLLLCKSAGSSYAAFFDCLIARKISETLSFFRSAGLPHPDERVLKLMVDGQFHTYFQIVRDGYDLDTARLLMQSAVRYHTAGWMTLLGIQDKKTEVSS